MIIKTGVYTLAEMLELTQKKTKQQLERHLISKNYIFSAEGRGKDTIYTITKVSDEAELGFKATYPTAMKVYLEYIKSNTKQWEWESDSEVAWNIIKGTQKLDSKSRMIYICRKELCAAGYIKNLNEQEEVKYFIKNKSEKQEITQEEFFTEIAKRTIYKDLLTNERSAEVFALDSIAIKEISDEAFWESFAQVGGALIRLKKRELLKQI